MANETTNVEFTRPKLERLKSAIAEAEKGGADTFTFEGDEYLVTFAKYMAQYLEPRLPPGGE